MTPDPAVLPPRRALWVAALTLLPACGAVLGPDYPTTEVVDDSALSDSTRALYRDDAALLALQLMGHPERWPVDLPADLIEQLYRALVAVHNAPDLPARDSVVALYRIHMPGRPLLREIIVSWDSGATWPTAWSRGERLTGYEPVDQLILAYDLWPRRPQWCTSDGCTYYQSRWIVLRAPDPLNTAALAARFTAVPGIRFAEPNGVVGDGDRITAQAQGDRWRLTYSKGYGDCPAGCLSRHFWAFGVDRSGKVTFDGSWGDSPPPP